MTERWKPEKGEWYWFVGSDMVPREDQWENFYLDGDYYESGNCFRTEEEAKAAAEKVKALLLVLHKNQEKMRTSPEHSQKVRRSTPDYYKRFFKDVEIQVNDITHLWNLLQLPLGTG